MRPINPFRKKIRLYVSLVLVGLFFLHLALLVDLYGLLAGQF